MKFNTVEVHLQEQLESNKFFPWILIATASFIVNGLDSDQIYRVIHVGFPSGILDAIQEMGRCGRNRIDGNSLSAKTKDKYKLLFNINNFVYMNQILYKYVDKEELKKQEPFDKVRDIQ